LKTSVIIPVKTFLNSKTRLGLSSTKTSSLCRLFLREVVKTVSNSELVDEVIIITNENQISDIINEFNCKKIIDKDETGVNNAIKLAEDYLLKNDFTCSIILPLDVPFFYSEEIDKLIQISSTNSVVIVPSRHFDGTNALVRNPINSMEPRYDEGSHSYQIDSAKKEDVKISIGLINRLMLDIDNIDDIEYSLKQNIKPELCENIRNILED